MTTRLDDLYRMVAYIYRNQNEERPLASTFAHFVETCGMLSVHSRNKSREEITVQDALCKALGWFFPLMAKLRISSVEDLIYRKFPYVCPYCRLAPHQDAVCKTVRGTSRTVDHEALRGKFAENASRRPVTLDQWQKMFDDIYPRDVDDARSGRSGLGLLEEVGELAEAIRVVDRYPKYVAGESADVFSYLMGIANEHALREAEQERDFSLEAEFVKRYPGLCPQCGYRVCICPPIPEATVGRLAKELDLAPFNSFIVEDMAAFDQAGRSAANAVLERIGGYAAWLTSEDRGRFPLDRGEANQSLFVLLLQMADEVESNAAADSLRSAALKVVQSTKAAGTKGRSQEVTQVIDGLLSRGDLRGLLARQGSSSPLSESVLKLVAPPVLVLVVFACPKGYESLRLQQEEAAIRESIALSTHRDSIQLDTSPSTTRDRFRRALARGPYRYVHFAGHGGPATITFEDERNDPDPVPLQMIGELLSNHPSVECVVLNSCESVVDLDTRLARWTIGMEESLTDEAAIAFSTGFYDAVGAGRDPGEAAAAGAAAARFKGHAGFEVKILGPS